MVVLQIGLKTGLYYLRTKAAADAIKFTVDVDALKILGWEREVTCSSNHLRWCRDATLLYQYF